MSRRCNPVYHYSGPVVNFINVKHTNFSYEHCVLAAFSGYMYVEKQRPYKKFVRKMLMKLTPALFSQVDEDEHSRPLLFHSKCPINKSGQQPSPFFFFLRSQFQQHFTCAFFVRKWIEQLSVVMFQLLYFWHKSIGAKCACKMLMKLTPILFDSGHLKGKFVCDSFQ